MLQFLALIFIFVKPILTIPCECSLYDLEEQEKLNKELYRIRIELPNGLNKYSDTQYTYYSSFKCDSVALYDVLIESSNFSISNKQCKRCTSNGWTNLMNCESDIKCDRDNLIGQPILHLPNLEPPPIDQKLFKPGQVVVVYKYSSYKVCKICHPNGEWSKYPEQELCKKVQKMKNSASCDTETLVEQEQRHPDYIRMRIESPDGLRKLTQKSDDKFYPDGTVILYQTYLNNFVHIFSNTNFTYRSFNPSSSFLKKSCRYCVNGVWSDLESCTILNCDKSVLTGSPDFTLLSTNLKPSDEQNLFKPYSVLATYSFGDMKFCKQCHENGEWSRYSASELCPNATTYKLERIQMNRPLLRYRNINDDIIFNNELSCNLDVLNSIESNFKRSKSFNLSRLYLVSDIKQKLNPLRNAKIPSRSLSIYELWLNKTKTTYCSICINGVWTNISEHCSENSNINFCERTKLNGYTGVPIRIVDIHNNKVSDSQELFEPGSVRVIYQLSETTRLCKVCEEKSSALAEWSRFAEARLCQQPLEYENNLRIRKFLNGCKIIDLDNETNAYFREKFLSWDSKRYLNEETSEVPDYSMVVFKNKLTNSKYCRRCNNGKWDNYTVCPVEFSIQKCDPFVIRGANFFINKFDGLKLTENEKNDLVMPGNVIAVYQFGDQKFCKECLQNGTWSRFPTQEMCKNLRI